MIHVAIQSTKDAREPDDLGASTDDGHYFHEENQANIQHSTFNLEHPAANIERALRA
jgi:hypothetical protein